MPVLSLLVLMLSGAWTSVPQGGDETRPPPQRCCTNARIVIGGVVGTGQCSRTDCLSHVGPPANPLAACGGLVAKDTVVNAACQNCPEQTKGTCDPNAMVAGNHSSPKINCDFAMCDSNGDGIDDGSECVITPAPGEPPTVIPYNKCATKFTICPCT